MTHNHSRKSSGTATMFAIFLLATFVLALWLIRTFLRTAAILYFHAWRHFYVARSHHH